MTRRFWLPGLLAVLPWCRRGCRKPARPFAPAVARRRRPRTDRGHARDDSSPLDRINTGNCNQLGGLAVQADILGPRPEYKLEGTPLAINGVLYTTGGTRRSVVALDGKTGELMWAHSLREGRRAGISPRQLSGRGLSYWSDGRGDDRILYITTGYRLGRPQRAQMALRSAASARTASST